MRSGHAGFSSNPTRRIAITVTKGDSIHHPQHGIGKVQSVRKRSFTGANGNRFAKVFFPKEDLTVMVREEDLPDTVRKPIKRSVAREVFEHIGQWNEKVSNQWKTRATKHQAKLDDGDPFALAEVYKTLVQRDQDDKLSAADRRHLSICQQRLSEELAMALGHSEQKALRRMEKMALA